MSLLYVDSKLAINAKLKSRPVSFLLLFRRTALAHWHMTAWRKFRNFPNIPMTAQLGNVDCLTYFVGWKGQILVVLVCTSAPESWKEAKWYLAKCSDYNRCIISLVSWIEIFIRRHKNSQTLDIWLFVKKKLRTHSFIPLFLKWFLFSLYIIKQQVGSLKYTSFFPQFAKPNVL